MVCEVSTGIDSSGPGLLVEKCGKPARLVRTSAFFWEVALCPEHARCYPGKYHVRPHVGCVLR